MKTLNDVIANLFIWKENPWPVSDSKKNLHIGCGERLLDTFVNVDFLPSNPNVLEWDLLDIWPTTLNNRLKLAFSEDVLEHFFYNEQSYILCAMNVALERGGVFRVLMPSLDKLLGNYSTFSGPLEVFFIA